MSESQPLMATKEREREGKQKQLRDELVEWNPDVENESQVVTLVYPRM